MPFSITIPSHVYSMEIARLVELGRGAHSAQMGNSRWSLQLAVQTGFRSSLRDAVSDSLELASDMIVFFVRFVIVMLPVLVFVVLPSGLVLRYVVRRAKRMRLAEALATPSAE